MSYIFACCAQILTEAGTDHHPDFVCWNALSQPSRLDNYATWTATHRKKSASDQQSMINLK